MSNFILAHATATRPTFFLGRLHRHGLVWEAVAPLRQPRSASLAWIDAMRLHSRMAKGDDLLVIDVRGPGECNGGFRHPRLPIEAHAEAHALALIRKEAHSCTL